MHWWHWVGFVASLVVVFWLGTKVPMLMALRDYFKHGAGG